MKRNYGIIIWALLLAATLFLALIIPDAYTSQIWAVVIFDVIAFVSQLVLWLSKSKNARGTFYKYPAMTMSTVYLILQFVISTIVAIVNEAMPFKIVLIINFVLLIIMWVILLSTYMAKDKIESLDSRQKDYHTIL